MQLALLFSIQFTRPSIFALFADIDFEIRYRKNVIMKL